MWVLDTHREVVCQQQDATLSIQVQMSWWETIVIVAKFFQVMLKRTGRSDWRWPVPLHACICDLPTEVPSSQMQTAVFSCS